MRSFQRWLHHVTGQNYGNRASSLCVCDFRSRRPLFRSAMYTGWVPLCFHLLFIPFSEIASSRSNNGRSQNLSPLLQLCLLGDPLFQGATFFDDVSAADSAEDSSLTSKKPAYDQQPATNSMGVELAYLNRIAKKEELVIRMRVVVLQGFDQPSSFQSCLEMLFPYSFSFKSCKLGRYGPDSLLNIWGTAKSGNIHADRLVTNRNRLPNRNLALHQTTQEFDCTNVLMTSIPALWRRLHLETGSDCKASRSVQFTRILELFTYGESRPEPWGENIPMYSIVLQPVSPMTPLFVLIVPRIRPDNKHQICQLQNAIVWPCLQNRDAGKMHNGTNARGKKSKDIEIRKSLVVKGRAGTAGWCMWLFPVKKNPGQ
nr:ethylene-insensitive protein 2-like isoform X1 [Ipomoea batatas]